MQLQLYWPICGASPLNSFRTHRHHHFANGAPDTSQTVEHTPQLCLPCFLSLPLRRSYLNCCFFRSREASLKHTNSFLRYFVRLLTMEKTEKLRFHLKAWKAKSDWQTSEYLCVYTHSSSKANICPKHRQTQMFSSRLMSKNISIFYVRHCSCMKIDFLFQVLFILSTSVKPKMRSCFSALKAAINVICSEMINRVMCVSAWAHSQICQTLQRLLNTSAWQFDAWGELSSDN